MAKRSRLIWSATLVLLLVAVSACANGNGGSRNPDESMTIKLGVQPYISYAGIFIALEKGYFEEAGVKVDPEMSRATGSELTSALVAGDFDVTGAGLTAGFFNAITRGVDVQIIAHKGGNKGDVSYTYLLVRKELVENGQVTEVADLRGRRIGTAAPGDANWIQLGMLLEGAGLSMDDVEVVNLDGPSRLDALNSGDVDAIIVPEPFVSAAMQTGEAEMLVPIGSLGENLEAVLITRQDYIEENREVLENFLAGYVRGVEDYVDDPNDPANVAAISKYTEQEEATIEKTNPFYIPRDARVDDEPIDELVDWLIEQELLKESLPVEEMFTNDLLPE